MNSMSYLDLHRAVAQDIDAEIETALERLGPSCGTTKSIVAKLLEQRKLRHPLSVLPLLTHAIETGRPGPAVPLSAVHLLWWTSACYLDDLADANGASISGELTENEALLASVVTGNALPIQIILAQDLPDSVRSALITEFLNGWIIGVDGQTVDMRGDIMRRLAEIGDRDVPRQIRRAVRNDHGHGRGVLRNDGREGGPVA